MLDSVRGWKASTRWWIVAGIFLAGFAVTASLKPIPNPPAYHDFADKRPLLSVPNSLDVLSNFAFLLSGILGLWFSLRRGSPLTAQQRGGYGLLFAGLILTSIGSAYYHQAPDNARLVWDRLPMTIAMAGFIAALLTDRVGKIGVRLMPLMAVVGVASVLQWGWSEGHGHGDLRWYALYQGMTMILGVAVMIMFASRFAGTREFVIAAACNVAAKFFELFDKPIFALNGIVSGHTLKHLSAGLGFLPLVFLLRENLLTTKDTKEHEEKLTAENAK
jgi:hypothetical protein